MTWSREAKNSCIDTAPTEHINRGGWGRQAISNSEERGERCGTNRHRSRKSGNWEQGVAENSAAWTSVAWNSAREHGDSNHERYTAGSRSENKTAHLRETGRGREGISESEMMNPREH